MKLRIEGSRIVANLTDEGRAAGFVVEAMFRYADSQIIPVIVFAARPDAGSALADRDLRRVVQVLGPTQVIPWTGKPFTLQPPAATEVSGPGRRLQSFRKLQKLGVTGTVGARK